MKVLYILSGTTIYGGATKAFLNLLKGAMRLGVEPGVFLPDREGIYKEIKENEIPVAISNFRFACWPPSKTLLDILLFVPRLTHHTALNILAYHRLLRFAREWKPDIIHTNVSVVDIGYKVARKLGIQHVWHVREYGDFDFDFAPSYASFLGKLNSDGNYCIAITNGVKEHHNLSDKKCEVIYDGVLSENVCRYNSQKSSYFLFAGRLEEAKGIEMCIRAYVSYYHESKTTAELWVAGDTVESQYFAYLRDLATGAPIKFLGMRKDIYDLMYNAKALIVPSRHEGFGFITAEAMFNGCLVIGRNTSGTKEQMDNGKSQTGKEIALRFETEEELTARIREVDSRDISEYENMILRGQSTASKLYSSENHVKKVMNVYKRIYQS